MTIKPVVVAPTSKRVTAPDKDVAEGHGHSHGTHSGQVVVEQGSQQNVVVRSAASHSHRNVNVVIDGQSPQRRSEVYDEIARHRRSPHKNNSRSKRRDHHDHHKRERCEREKHPNVVGATGGSSKCNSPHVHGVAAAGACGSGASGSSPANVRGKSPEHLPAVLGCPSPQSQTAVTQAAANMLKAVEETFSGYNSGDEHLQPKEGAITVDEWQRRDEQFAKCMSDRGYVLKPVEEDGACLFRSISLQIYGDEEMHDVIRQQTMDYIYKNREYFCHFVTEDINSYIKRKRRKDSHGNHIEIQAISEIYSRPVEVYCYKPTPINIFNSEQLNNGFAPLRLSYQRGSHYNAIIDPYNATVGVGLGLAGYKPELQTKEAARLSEQLEIEQTMFEDKLKTTDWEATNEAIEEQIARESYLQWCRENLQKSRASTSATVTSAEAAASDAEASPSKYSLMQHLRNANNSNNIAGDGNGGSNSTLTAAAVAGVASGSAGGLSSAGGGVTASSLSLLEHKFALSPKSLSALAHNLKKDAAQCDMGFESDDTDMSSTSSMGNCGNNSPSSTALRSNKSKQRNGTVRSGKKRRREQSNAPAGLAARNEPVMTVETPTRKSPRRDSPLAALVASSVPPPVEARNMRSRGHTPDAEQLPSTSKQSHPTPEKELHNQNNSKMLNAEPFSTFYQELLEASYATDGCGQLSESEMLQRAIQMSTQDFIEDQSRKYLYGP